MSTDGHYESFVKNAWNLQEYYFQGNKSKKVGHPGAE